MAKLKLAAMHSAAACAIQQNTTCPHRNFVTSVLPTQNRIQQNLPPHPNIHDPGGQPTGFDDPYDLLAGQRVFAVVLETTITVNANCC